MCSVIFYAPSNGGQAYSVYPVCVCVYMYVSVCVDVCVCTKIMSGPHGQETS